MGQYYKAVLLDEDKKADGFVSSYDFGSGAKIMEHSWMRNDFVGFVEKLLKMKPKALVWAGDYADEEEGQEENLYFIADEETFKITHNEYIKDNAYNQYRILSPSWLLMFGFSLVINICQGVIFLGRFDHVIQCCFVTTQQIAFLIFSFGHNKKSNGDDYDNRCGQKPLFYLPHFITTNNSR